MKDELRDNEQIMEKEANNKKKKFIYKPTYSYTSEFYIRVYICCFVLNNTKMNSKCQTRDLNLSRSAQGGSFLLMSAAAHNNNDENNNNKNSTNNNNEEESQEIMMRNEKYDWKQRVALQEVPQGARQEVPQEARQEARQEVPQEVPQEERNNLGS